LVEIFGNWKCPKFLGLTAEQKVGIWEIKEGTSQIQSLLAYGISGITGLAVLILKLKLR